MSEKTINSGVVRWYKPGTRKLHRLNGPAVEFLNGTKQWWNNDRLHRLDGPAIEYPSGGRVWYVNDQHYHDAISAKYAIAKWICNHEIENL